MSTKTVAQLARLLGIDESEVSKAAGEVLENPHARDRQFKLKRIDVARILQARGWEFPAPPSAPSSEEDRDEEPDEDGLATRPDPLADPLRLRFRDLEHRPWVHGDVLHAVSQESRFKKRLSIVLQHLASQGRTSQVKACSDEANRGWWRSPLAGKQGKQFYLWWASQGARPVKQLDVPPGNVLVRAVRHHDDHSPLTAGELDDYLPMEQPDLTGESYVAPAWTHEQLEFVRGEDPVRFVVGRPGSGKTTVLWNAIETRNDARVLYLTWSRDLLQVTRQRLRAFASEDVRVETRWDFTSFLSELCGEDVRRISLAGSQDLLRDVTRRIPAAALGPWSGRDRALHAELRAFLVGRARPGQPDSVPWQGLVRLTDTAYLDQRGPAGGVGRSAAGALLGVVDAIESVVPEAFPELAAATRALARLGRDELPPGFAEFDRVVVDEAQDLTLLELTVVTELCRALHRARGVAPWLLLAGDEGQTVRPSGFDWGPVTDLVARRVGPPRKFHLEENLRCPARIAAVIDRASEEYVQLEKRRRPSKQRPARGGQHTDAHLLHVVVPDEEAAAELLEQLDGLDDVVVLSAHDEPPAWVPPSLRELVLTPGQAKGLEYQSVCLLDPGKVLVGLQERLEDGLAHDLEEHACRTTIDQLRVALSRATETLAFVDVAPTESERRASEHLLGDPAPFDPEDLVDHFEEGSLPAEERILRRTADARSLLDERPARAWRRALQAVRLLGDPELPNGVSSPQVREEAQVTLLATASRLLVDGIPPGLSPSELYQAVHFGLPGGLRDDEDEAFSLLDVWCRDRSRSPLDLLDATLDLEESGSWLRDALAPVAQTLRRALETCARDPVHAAAYDHQVDGWLDLTGFLGDLDAEARRLRCLAVETLLDAGYTKAAEDVLALVLPAERRLEARLHEARGDFPRAAETFEEIGAAEDALRCWRNAADWSRALGVVPAESVTAKDLRWLQVLERTLAEQPDGLVPRLTDAERARLRKLLEAVSKSAGSNSASPRKRRRPARKRNS